MLHVRFKENLVIRDYLDPELFFQSLNNVVLPIRKISSEWKNDFNREFAENCLDSPVSLFINGNDIKRRGYSQEALT